ncbi:MAG: ThuA domain-containing protein [Terriglobia bacterium]
MRQTHKAFLLLLAVLALAMGSGPGSASGKTSKSGKLLYMTLCRGYHHQSIPLSEQIVKQIGEKSGAFEVTVTEDVGAFTKENLKNYSAVMFYTTGELPFTDEEKTALVDFLKSGHGFVGVHSATDTLYEWGVYNKIVGGYFNEHPWHQLVMVDVVDPNSKLVSALGKSFQITDEIYQIADFQADNSHVLLALDPTSVDLGKSGVHRRYYGWPIAWTRTFGNGRVYYNSLGHEEAVWTDPRYQDMLLKGIKWVMKEED